MSCRSELLLPFFKDQYFEIRATISLFICSSYYENFNKLIRRKKEEKKLPHSHWFHHAKYISFLKVLEIKNQYHKLINK